MHSADTAPKVVRTLQAGFDKISDGAGQRGRAWLMKAYLPWLLPTWLHRVIFMDSDLVLLRNVLPLWQTFDHFTPRQALALVRLVPLLCGPFVVQCPIGARDFTEQFGPFPSVLPRVVRGREMLSRP